MTKRSRVTDEGSEAFGGSGAARSSAAKSIVVGNSGERPLNLTAEVLAPVLAGRGAGEFFEQ